MATGAQPITSWQDTTEVEEAEARAPAALPPPDQGQEAAEEVPPSRGNRETRPAILLAVLALSWLGLALWAALEATSASPRPAIETIRWLALASAPLALLGVGYILLGRTSRREARRFVKVARAMRMEASQLEQMLGALSDRIDANRRALGEQAHALLLLGDDASARLADITASVAREGEALAAQTAKLEAASADTRTDMGVLLSDLPRAEALAREIGSHLRDVGLAAETQTSALRAEMAALTAKSGEADEQLTRAAETLAAQLARIESATEAAASRLIGTADEARGALDDVLARAADTLDQAHKGIAAQNAALLAMVDEARAVLEGAGSDAASALNQRLEAIGTRLEGFGKVLAAQEEAAGALLGSVEQKLSGLADGLDGLSQSGGDKLDLLGNGVAEVQQHATALDATLTANREHISELAKQAEAVNRSLERSRETLHESLPSALRQLEEQAVRSGQVISSASAEAMKLVASATATAARLGEAETTLQRQQSLLDALASTTGDQLGALEQQAQALGQAIETANGSADRLAESAGPQLIETLVRVREAAAQAAQKARDAIAEVIPEAMRGLTQAAGPAAAEALQAHVEGQLAAVSNASERAVQAAHRATERLMRQMLTIADTTASIESRVAEAKAELEEQDQDASARRVALLIESLNSIAIDVTKILSNDVTDSAWAAYLKGDRGIFTRRAVRLLDHSQAREIVRHYEEEAEFREQVNRYIHDFESMLRRVLAARDGSPLSITLLSSDMGKLYVALAQAIERLRT